MNSRRDPIESESLDFAGAAFSHPTGMVKLGVKGRDLVRWAGENGVAVPSTVFETRLVGDRGVLARVGSDEIILESDPGEPQLFTIEQALRRPWRGIYRVEQQAATYELAGPLTKRVLAQTCAINFQDVESSRLIFTRVAGVSCCIIPRCHNADLIRRIWVDYTYARYLAETLAIIISELMQNRP